MSNSPEDFEKLQKLLKLKRHEQPPPGYFNHFSDHVISRIESMNRQKDRWEEAPWVGKIFRLLESNPIVAGVFGISVCGLLISSIAFSQSRGATDFSVDSIGATDMAASGKSGDWAKNVRADSTSPSINPMFNTNVPGALFGSMDKLSVQQVNFTPGN